MGKLSETNKRKKILQRIFPVDIVDRLKRSLKNVQDIPQNIHRKYLTARSSFLWIL